MSTVLICDDSMFQRYMIGKVAKELGHDIVEAKDGLDCLAKARTLSPEAVLLDLNMPVLGGIEVLEALAGEGSAPNVVVLTADIQETTRARCLALGAREVVNKPLDEAPLRALFHRMLSE